jgi:pimeloyl-ACP methyl ester carboxylesterase/ketosteroid isomerase-like protein
MATQNPTHDPASPAQIKAAGMAADLYGCADERPPLVLLPGLTFDRAIWQPVLDQLARVDPGRQILSLDLPGHGDSPDQLPHSMGHVVDLIHQAVAEAGLDTPVVVGHSISGGTASLYAARHPTRGVINIDSLPDPALFARLRSMEDQIRGDGFPGVWAVMEQSFGTGQLPSPARDLVARTSRPQQDLVVSYWDEVLRQTPDQMGEMLASGFAAVAASGVPYLLIAGAEPPPDIARWLSDAMPQMKIEVWAETGHFPHLAHPGRFAQRLAATAEWQPGSTPRRATATVQNETRAWQSGTAGQGDGSSLTPAQMDLIIDAHFDAERRDDIEAILDTVSDDIGHETFGTGLDRLQGKDAVRSFYEQLSQDLHIDAYTTVRRMHGPDHAWEEGVVYATAKGKPFGLDGRRRSVTYRLNHLFEFRGGLIHRELGIPDIASILRQLSQSE